MKSTHRPDILRATALVWLTVAVLPLSACAQADRGAKPPAELERGPAGDVNAAVTASRTNAIVTAAAKCSPAVVTIDTVQTIRRRVFNPFLSPQWQDFFRDFMAPPYQEYEEEIPSMGSGFLFSDDGYILTAEHVVHGADKIEVTLPDNRTLPAVWVGSDYANDVAVLKVEGADLPHVELGDSSSAMIGEWVIAIGNPFGHVVESASPTVSVGVISAVDRNMKSAGQGGMRFYADLLQTDASINPGNSGGPLVDAAGEVLGINVTIITTSGGSLGIGFAVPINKARDVARELIESGDPHRPWVGVYLQEVDKPIANTFNFPDDNGLLIADIDENGPAYKSNLRRGDVILAVNGKDVNDAAAYENILNSINPGGTVQLRVRRGTAIMEGRVPTEKRPGP